MPKTTEASKIMRAAIAANKKPAKKRAKKEYIHKRTEPIKAKIGIDTGTTTGVAVWADNALQVVDSMTITKAMVFITKHYPVDSTKLYIEDARLWIGFSGKTEQTEARRKGAGSVQRDAKIWQDWCEENGYDFIMIKPMGKGLKKDADTFKKMTGWQGVTNEHSRDAGMIVYQR